MLDTALTFFKRLETRAELNVAGNNHDEGAIELREADAGRAPRGSERKRGIDRVIMLLEALLKHRAPVRVGDIAKMINAPRSTTYEIVNSLLEAEMLENVGSEGHVYFGRAMHLFGWAYSHHNAHYRRIIEAMERWPSRRSRRCSYAACAATNTSSSTAAIRPGHFAFRAMSASRCRSRGRHRAGCCWAT